MRHTTIILATLFVLPVLTCQASEKMSWRS